ncbi:aminoglycoside phosphotransferase family protein [Plantactinospora alkalitolerans]|uniref:aminoglycoside phosphotransferase family protein n=1 Tax=Plantactinospora alkalitolerans TaxID=2789879 RepID=UPI002B1F353A|nr:aminoglycoside phosphotransferase family protein [Plantactinospora alkalitolerans]
MTVGGLRPDEVPIDAALVRRLVAAQFPQWAELPVRSVARSGMDNATYRLGEEMSVRLPRVPRWAGQVEREQRWLPRLAPHLPLAVPVPLAEGRPDEGFPFPWSVYCWLDGENATLDRITEPHRAAVELAEFIAALQRIDPTGGPPPEWSNGFRGVPMGDDRDSAVVEPRIRDRIAALAGLADTDALTAVFDAALAAPARAAPPVWVHGDPAPANMLVRDGRLTAVIDFGTLAVGDPAVDMIAAWTFLDAATRDVFRATLAVDDATWARGRGWGLTGVLPDPAVLADPVHAAPARRRLDDIVADHRQYG